MIDEKMKRAIEGIVRTLLQEKEDSELTSREMYVILQFAIEDGIIPVGKLLKDMLDRYYDNRFFSEYDVRQFKKIDREFDIVEFYQGKAYQSMA